MQHATFGEAELGAAIEEGNARRAALGQKLTASRYASQARQLDAQYQARDRGRAINLFGSVLG